MPNVSALRKKKEGEGLGSKSESKLQARLDSVPQGPHRYAGCLLSKNKKEEEKRKKKEKKEKKFRATKSRAEIYRSPVCITVKEWLNPSNHVN
jgi:hypothetical protein